jgi:hypothetical protein
MHIEFYAKYATGGLGFADQSAIERWLTIKASVERLD